MFTSSLYSLTSWLSWSTSSSSELQEQRQQPFVLAFGNSSLTQRLLLEEIILVGGGLLFPLAVVIGLCSIRWAALYNPFPNYVRYDVWNLMVRFVVADMLLECLLLPRFQCVMILPSSSTSNNNNNYTYDYYTWEWVLQSLGYGGCQRMTTSWSWEKIESSNIFVGSPSAMGIMFAIRLLWICLGVYIGEGFCPICLTGGIACGKSTVAQYLLDPPPTAVAAAADHEHINEQVNSSNDYHQFPSSSEIDHSSMDHAQDSSMLPNNHNSSGNSKLVQRRKSNSSPHPPPSSPGGVASPNTSSRNKKNKTNHQAAAVSSISSPPAPSSSSSSSSSSTDPNLFMEGTVYLVDTDSIAHEILLPPGDPKSTIDPAMSVYEQIVEAFGAFDILEDDEPNDDHDSNNGTTATNGTRKDMAVEDDDDDLQQELLDTSSQGRQNSYRRRIDRRKLGAIIFADPSKRRILNRLTHPRIRIVLIQRLLYGLYRSGKDFCIADVPLLFESGGPLRWMFGIVLLVTCRTPGLQLQRLSQRNLDLTLEQCQQRIDSQMPLEKKEQMSHIVLDNSGTKADLAAAVERARDEMMMRIHGLGISLFQMLLILGGSVPVAVLSKMYSVQNANGNQT